MRWNKIVYKFIICCFLMMVIIHPDIFAWNSKVHKEVALDAWYYMEHSTYATQRQKKAIKWFYNNFNTVSNHWDIIAEGAIYPDKVEHVCFCGDAWPEASHYTKPRDHNMTSLYHFIDMYSAYINYRHSEHSNCKNFALPDYKGEHNSWDGYNYRRHEELIADYDSDDSDSWAAWGIDDDNFCTVHTKDGLQLYEYSQGGKGENGLPIGPNNHSCYSRWNQNYSWSDECPNADYWNIIFAPIDNVGRAYYQLSIFYRNLIGAAPLLHSTFQDLALYYLGAAMHTADASVFHHIFNTCGWGHANFEGWADYWYNDQKWFKDQFKKIKWYIDSYYTKDNIDPINRPLRWLVHQLAWSVFNNESINTVWDRDVNEDDGVYDYDSKYWNYCVKAYPATVALAVIIMEKFYIGKEETFQQQAYDHQMTENVIVTPTTPSVKVTVKKFVLVEETDPESGGDDDIYGYFTVKDGVKSENYRIPSSGEYGMDEGDPEDLNSIIFETSHVGQYLEIKADIWDEDWPSSDDIVGQGNLYLTKTQNWGKGGIYKIQCKYPYADGHLDVYIEIK